MIKALLLIFEPGVTWDKIVQARRTVRFIFWAYLVPLITLSTVGEVAGLLYLGKRVEVVGKMARISYNQAVYYGLGQFMISLVVVFCGAKLIKIFGETFHSRHSYVQCFTLVAYALSPLFLVRLLDAFPGINPWVSFAIGMILSVAVVYQGVPRLLQPDPPHAFGLFLTSAVLLTLISGLARFVTVLLLHGKLNLL